MRRLAVLLSAAALLAGCGGADEPGRELVPGTRIRIGIVAGDAAVARGARIATNRIDNAGGIGGALTIDLVRGPAEHLLASGVRLLVLPCREGLVRAARLVEAREALAVAPCDDGVLDPSLRRVFATGLSPRAQAEALEAHVGDEPVRLLAAESPRGRRVRALLRLREGGTAPVSPEAPEAPTPPPGTPEGTIFATYGFPTPGNRVDEFAERFKAVFGVRPASILPALGGDAVEAAQSTEPLHVGEALREGLEVRGALGQIVFQGGTTRPVVEATVLRVGGGRLRPVPGG